MSISKTFHCIVDDTALITNISEIEQWVQKGLVALIIPLHTLERLHLLKKDTSQIGQNARKAVKFLDQITSKDDLPHDPVIIQGPEDQYVTWQEVETHYSEEHNTETGLETPRVAGEDSNEKLERQTDQQKDESAGLPEMLSSKLRVEKSEKGASPLSTPPLSPSSSGLLSSKTTPEMRSATVNDQDMSPVPPTLKALINPIVWYTYESKSKTPAADMIFLTNSGDTALLARDFGVNIKTIHQLRQAIGVEEQEVKNRDKYQKKHAAQPTSPKREKEPKTLFRYDEASSDDEEVVFKPRSRGGNRGQGTARAGATGSMRMRSTPGHSPSNSMSSPAIPKPQVPTEEIDPDSFDRGGFARGSIPLANVGSAGASFNRGNFRGQSNPSGTRGGGGFRGGQHRGNNAARGRGRLFVP